MRQAIHKFVGTADQWMPTGLVGLSDETIPPHSQILFTWNQPANVTTYVVNGQLSMVDMNGNTHTIVRGDTLCMDNTAITMENKEETALRLIQLHALDLEAGVGNVLLRQPWHDRYNRWMPLGQGEHLHVAELSDAIDLEIQVPKGKKCLIYVIEGRVRVYDRLADSHELLEIHETCSIKAMSWAHLMKIDEQ